MEEKHNLFQIVASVLHLGNNTFEENNVGHKVAIHTGIVVREIHH